MATERIHADRASRRAGVVVTTDDRRFFVPAEVAKKLISEPTITPVPGTDFGMALVSGHVVAVVWLGKSSGAALVCEVEGEILALAGVAPQQSDFFEAAPGGVRVDGERVPDLDVAAIARALSRRMSGGTGEIA
jgi:hypothetical protein